MHLYEIFVILRRNQRNIIVNIHRSSRRVPVVVLMEFEFLDKFSKNSQISNFMKNRPKGGESFHADERIDRRIDSNGETKSRFWQFCELA